VLFIALTCIPMENVRADEDNKYIEAVREFADNVLKYGRDTYGPKHTPLFVDGVNVNTHEPVKWISPDCNLFSATETEEWILSNFGSQQTLLRTLDGLSEVTRDPKYRDAAMQAVKYAFENLRAPNGLFYWGHHVAYDAQRDEIKYAGSKSHILKVHYPYYELMWQVDSEVTKRFIEAYWSAHVIDWSRLDFNRIASYSDILERPWGHEYDEGAPIFFQGKHAGGGFFNTATSLAHAATTLYQLSNNEEQSLIWGRRLIKRFIDTRHPKTGMTKYMYNMLPFNVLGNDFKDHFSDPHSFIFPSRIFAKVRNEYYPESVVPHQWMSLLLMGDALGEHGEEFTQWAVEELRAWGKLSYREEDNSFIPIITDGTKIEGYILKDPCAMGDEGDVAISLFADMSFLWAYAMAYRMTGDEFMWQMIRSIVAGNNLGDIGENYEDYPELKTDATSSNVYGLLAFLNLYEKTNNKEFLKVAQRIGDNILGTKLNKGFFVPSKNHIYTRFDCLEPLALLCLIAEFDSKRELVPRVWPSSPLFVPSYRYRKEGVDRRIIYTLTASPEVPISFQEAAHVGNIKQVAALLESGVNVDSVDDSFRMTALQRAAIQGHKEIVALLLAKGANPNHCDVWPGGTALDYAAEHGHKEVVQLLITKGADINAKNNNGQTPLDIAMSNARMDIASVLIDNGAEASFFTKMRVSMARAAEEQKAKEKETGVAIHTAVQSGNQQKVKALLDQGADINAKDDKGNTILHYAVREGYKELVDLLVSRGADVNLIPEKGYSPLHYAVWNEDVNTVKLLVDHGAQFNEKDPDGWTAFYNAVWQGSREIVDFLVSKGADISTFHMAAAMGDVAGVKTFLEQGLAVDTKDEMECTPLSWASCMGQVEVVKLLIAQGADVNLKLYGQSTTLQQAVRVGNSDIAQLLITQGADVNAKEKNGRGPLHRAAQSGHREVVQLLLANGADASAKDSRDRTPLDLAKQRGHTEIIEILTKAAEEKGASKEQQTEEKNTEQEESSSESPDMPAEK